MTGFGAGNHLFDIKFIMIGSKNLRFFPHTFTLKTKMEW